MRLRVAVIVGSLSCLGLVACSGGEPQIYRVAIDETPIRTLTIPSCFKGNVVPNDRQSVDEQNFRKDDDWAIWDGADKQYLDLGSQQWKLGSAPTIDVGDLIEGSGVANAAGKYEFSARRTQNSQSGNVQESRQTTVTVTWDDYSAAPTGNIQLTSTYACVGQDCNAISGAVPDSASCSLAINFAARRVDAQPMTMYSNNP